MILDCPKCGEPVMSDAATCAKCGTDMPGHGSALSAKDRAAESDLGLERTLLMIGLLGVFQLFKLFTARDAAPWEQAARGVAGLLGVVFLFFSQARDVSALGGSTKKALRFGVALVVLLVIATWLA